MHGLRPTVAVSLACQATAFSLAPGQSRISPRIHTAPAAARTSPATAASLGAEAEAWDLFAAYHSGAWAGVWETFDQIGDSVDETQVLFHVQLSEDGERAALTQTMNIEEWSSDCATCYDSERTRTMDLGSVGRGDLKRSTLAGPALVSGPTVLRSGIMSTELGLRYPSGDGRVRVTFQHAPAWAKGKEPGQGPPDALDLLRVTVRREAKGRGDGAPTREREQAANQAGTPVVPAFYRGVPPFRWAENERGAWRGSTAVWTLAAAGKTAGEGGSEDSPSYAFEPDRVLSAEAEADMWHERFTGDDDNTWYLRLPGGILLQTPQRLFNSFGQDDDDASEGAPRYEMRLAWLAEDDVLLRATAEVTALSVSEDAGSGAIRVAPPVLFRVTADELSRDGPPPEEKEEK